MELKFAPRSLRRLPTFALLAIAILQHDDTTRLVIQLD
jgi:hypothetical protein